MDIIRSWAKRHGVRLDHTSRTLGNKSSNLNTTSRARPGKPAKNIAALSTPIKHKIEIPLEDIDHPSTNLKRPLRGLLLKIIRLPGSIKRYWYMLRPPLTIDQQEQLELERLERSRDKLCIREARLYARKAANKLAQLGERELLYSQAADKPKRMKKVNFDCVARDELFTKVMLHLNCDPASLPAYVKVSELALKPLYADELLPTMQHYVKWDSNEAGVFLTVFRHGLEGLPDNFYTDEIWRKIPENKPPLTIPVGYGINSEKISLDLDSCPHLIVAGATKQGKSNFINQMLCFWLWRGIKPSQLNLILFDLKRGMEFSWYENLPHLYRDPDDYLSTNPRAWIATGIIEEMSQVMPAMERLRYLMDQRLTIIKAAGHKDFNAYNRDPKTKNNRLPSLVIVFDEWARIRLKIKEAETLLAEMTNICRAAGMYFILGTQNPNREVISSLIGVNFSTRIVFKSSVGGSMAALGDQRATDLEVKGRAVLQDGGDEKKLQTPQITDATIRAVVFKAITGREFKGHVESGVDIQEILEHSIKYLDGQLDVHKLYQIFREKKVRQRWLQAALKEAENKTFILSGKSYRVTPRTNQLGRRLVPDT